MYDVYVGGFKPAFSHKHKKELAPFIENHIAKVGLPCKIEIYKDGKLDEKFTEELAEKIAERVEEIENPPEKDAETE